MSADQKAAVRVLIVEDQDLLRIGLRKILEAGSGIEVVGDVGNGARGVAEALSLQPDVVLLDIQMPTMDGLEACRRILAANHPPKVLILTTYDIDEYVFPALETGASGFLLKDHPPELIGQAIKTVAAGDSVLAPSVTARLITRLRSGRDLSWEAQAKLESLTVRETEVLELVAQGMTNSEIAGKLHLGENTVKSHVGNTLTKLGVRDRVQATLVAVDGGLVTATTPGA